MTVQHEDKELLIIRTTNWIILTTTKILLRLQFLSILFLSLIQQDTQQNRSKMGTAKQNISQPNEILLEKMHYLGIHVYLFWRTPELGHLLCIKHVNFDQSKYDILYFIFFKPLYNTSMIHNVSSIHIPQLFCVYIGGEEKGINLRGCTVPLFQKEDQQKHHTFALKFSNLSSFSGIQ